MIADVWVPCGAFSFTLLSITRKYFLKYVTPEEYSQLRDHIRNIIYPLHITVKNADTQFDESFIEVPDDKPPVIVGLFLEIVERTLAEAAQEKN